MMKLSLSGLRSSRTCYAIYALIFFGLLATFSAGKAMPSTPQKNDGTDLVSLSISVACSSPVIVHAEWLANSTEPAMFAAVASDGQEIHISLSADVATGLEPGTSIARIKVSSMDGSCTQSFLLQVGGGGMIIAIDEF